MKVRALIKKLADFDSKKDAFVAVFYKDIAVTYDNISITNNGGHAQINVNEKRPIKKK